MADNGNYLDHSFIVKLAQNREQASLYYFTGETAARAHARKLYSAYPNAGVGIYKGNARRDPDGLNWKQLEF